MTKPIINLRCEGPILCEGTIFIKKENRGNGVVVNVLFERKGLGTALEMFKNIFLRKKNEESIGAKDWARNLADTAGGRPGYSTRYSIAVDSLIKNIKDASDASGKSFNTAFNLSLTNNEAAQEKIEFFAFVEKRGSLTAEMRDEEEKISQLYSGENSAYNELKIMDLEKLKSMQQVFNFLYSGEKIMENERLKFIQYSLNTYIANKNQ